VSLLIKGMEVPKDCIVCPFGWNGCNKQHDFVYMGSRPDFCQLIDVHEPHGRLIDADALMLKILDYIDEYAGIDDEGLHSEKWCAMKETEIAINEAPTIIEAEG